MDIHNRFVVAPGRRITHKGENYKAGRKFPAAKLNIPEESVVALVRDGSIYDPAELREDAKVAPPMDDGFGDLSKPELADIASRYGIDVKSRMTKEEILVAIRSRDDDSDPDEPPAEPNPPQEPNPE